MPANKKYLSSSPISKIVNLIIGLVGGAIISIETMIILGHLYNKEVVIETYNVFGFILWAVLFISTYVVKNIWVKIIGAILWIIILWGIIKIVSV